MTLFLERIAEYSAHNADLRPFMQEVKTQEFAFLRYLGTAPPPLRTLVAFGAEQRRRERAAKIRERAKRKAAQR